MRCFIFSISPCKLIQTIAVVVGQKQITLVQNVIVITHITYVCCSSTLILNSRR